LGCDAAAFDLAVDGRGVLRKVGGARLANWLEAMRRSAGSGMSTDEIMALTRGEE
jgi:hypothetical protein